MNDDDDPSRDPDPDYVPQEPDYVQPELERVPIEHGNDVMVMTAAWVSQPNTDAPRPPTDDMRRGSHPELMDRTFARLQLAGPVVHSEGSFWHYKDSGIWTQMTQGELYNAVRALDGAHVTNAATGKTKEVVLRKNDMLAVLDLLAAHLAQPEHFGVPASGVAFRNGFARVHETSGVTLEPHSPKHKARHCYGFDYEPAAAPLGWLKFLREVWHNEPDVNDRIDCLRQFIGLCLCGLATRYQAALVLFGEGSNGKSVISGIVRQAMPSSAVCSVSPQTMSNDYDRALLSGRLLNVVSELPEQDILNNEAWKAVISGDLIKAREIRQAPFMFKPVAGHLYSANRLPGTQDHTHGFWRRLIVMTFNRAFHGADCDTGLEARLIRDEQALIVSWAIEGVSDVIRNGKMTVPASSAAAVNAWRKDADQVAAFVEECTTSVAADDIGTDRMAVYREYRNWSERNGHRPVAMNKFGQRLQSLKIATIKPHLGARRYLLRLIEPD